MKKALTLLTIFCIYSNSFSQKYIHVEVGKANKKYTTDSINNYIYHRNLLKKAPDGLVLLPISNLSEEDLGKWQNRTDYSNLKVKYHNNINIVGDTAFISCNNEIVTTSPPQEFDRKIIPALAYKTNYVTNDEWNVFQHYVLDSIKRKKFSEEFPEELLTPVYDEDGDMKYENDWLINWSSNFMDKRLKNHPGDMEIFESLYLPKYERYYRKLQIDVRKQLYSYTSYDSELNEKIWNFAHTFADSLNWISLDSKSHYGDLEDQMAAYYHWHDQFKDAPICNVVGSQAEAFLNWKQKYHQKELDRKKENLIVIYRLPSAYEIEKIPTTNFEVIIPEFKLDKWRITNEGYEKFVHYVRDSIAMRILSEEISTEQYLSKTYNLSHDELPEDSWNINWKNRLNWNKLSEDEKKALLYFYIPKYELQDTTEKRIDPRHLMYEYYRLNQHHALKSSSFIDTTIITSNLPKGFKGSEVLAVSREGGKNPEIPVWSYPPFYNNTGLNYYGKMESTTYSEDKSRHIHRYLEHVYPTLDYSYEKEVKQFEENWLRKQVKNKDGEWVELYDPQIDYDVVPKAYDFTTNPDASVKINYAQAVAFYNWKKRQKGSVIEDENILIANYIPSVEEWKKIQAQDPIIKAGKTFKLPSPSFRYVIEYYPKEDATITPPEFVDYIMGGDQKLYKKGEKYAVFNYSNQQLCPFIYDEITYDYNDDLYLLKKDGKYGKMDYRGNIKIKVIYDEIKKESRSSNKYAVKKDGEWKTIEI